MIFPVAKICYLMWCEEPFTLGMVSRLLRALYRDRGQFSSANGDTVLIAARGSWIRLRAVLLRRVYCFIFNIIILIRKVF